MRQVPNVAGHVEAMTQPFDMAVDGRERGREGGKERKREREPSKNEGGKSWPNKQVYY